jgi:gluconate 2-dehydrogenase gamma chain
VSGDASRRDFLRAAAALGLSWTAADLGGVEAALLAARQDRLAGSPTKVLTAAQAAVIDAAASRILPSVDGRPGARDAGAVYFIDRALATFNRAGRQLYRNGIADLNRRARRASPPARDFAALAPAGQDAILRQIEQTPFFQTLRAETIIGTFALPIWGGNREHAGWRLIGFEHQPIFRPPFGFYDASVNRGA